MARGHKTGGRRKGTPNRVTTDVRGAIAKLAEGNVGHVQGWLDAVAKEEPAKALDLFLKLLEYTVPRLARTEVAGDADAPLRFVLMVPPKASAE